MPRIYEKPAHGLPDNFPTKGQRGFNKSRRPKVGENVYTGAEVSAHPGRLWTFPLTPVQTSEEYVLRLYPDGIYDVLELRNHGLYSIGRIYPEIVS